MGACPYCGSKPGQETALSQLLEILHEEKEVLEEEKHARDMLLAMYRELCERAALTLAAGGPRGQLISELRAAASLPDQ
jgi:hypothetical protein